MIGFSPPDRRRRIVYVCVFSCQKVIDVHAWRDPFYHAQVCVC